MDKHLLRNRKAVAFFPTSQKYLIPLTTAEKGRMVKLAWLNSRYQKAHQNGQPVPEEFQQFTNSDYCHITQGLKALARSNGYRAVWLMGNRPQSWRIH